MPPTLDNYTRRLNEERLRSLIETKNKAVAAVQAELDRQQGKRGTAAPGKCYSYPTNYSVSPVPKKVTRVTLEQAAQAELKKIRDQHALETLARQMCQVMSGWRE